jgi:signal recognition particle subunit SRP54
MRRKATKSPKNKRKGKKGGGRPAQPRMPLGGGFPGADGGGAPGGLPGGLPGGMPGGGLPPGFSMPNIDFSKLRKPKADPDGS